MVWCGVGWCSEVQVIQCVAACCGVLWLLVVVSVCTYGSRSVVVLRVLQCVAV